MSKYSAFFAYTGGGTASMDDLSWWKSIMARFIDHGDNFRVECREADEEGLKSCARMGALDLAQVYIEGGAEVWEGEIQDRFKFELINEPLDSSGVVKWHTVIIKDDNKTVLCCARNGREFSVYDIDEEDLAFLADAVRGYPFSLYSWDNAKSGQEVNFLPLYGKDSELDAMIKEFNRTANKN